MNAIEIEVTTGGYTDTKVVRSVEFRFNAVCDDGNIVHFHDGSKVNVSPDLAQELDEKIRAEGDDE